MIRDIRLKNLFMWYYRKASGDKGPYSSEEFIRLYEEGIIEKDMLVRKSNQYDWIPLKKYDEIISPPQTLKTIVDRVSQPNSSLLKYLVGFGFYHLEPLQFEELVLNIFKALGFKGELTPTTGDGGVDIELKISNDSRIIAQCKRYQSEQSVSVKDVRELLGSMVHCNAKCGYFITTSYFTEQAISFCMGKQIYLIDGNKLNNLFLLAVKTEINGTKIEDPIHFILSKLNL